MLKTEPVASISASSNPFSCNSGATATISGTNHMFAQATDIGTGVFSTKPEYGTTLKFCAPGGWDTVLKSDKSTPVITRLQCITTMKEYKSKSLEELRCEDYLAGRKGKAGLDIKSSLGTGASMMSSSGSFAKKTVTFRDPLTVGYHPNPSFGFNASVTSSDESSEETFTFGDSSTLGCDQKQSTGNDSSMNNSSEPTNCRNPAFALHVLSKKLEDMFLNELFWDMTIKVGEKDFHVHKVILAAQSSWFADKFQQDGNDSECSTVDITDCDPDVFKQFLNYLYSGKIRELSIENALSLYTIGHNYGVDELKADCVSYMSKNLSVDDFCDIIELAVKHNELVLLESLKEYFKRNTRKILMTLKWHLLMKESTTIANELILLVAPP